MIKGWDDAPLKAIRIGNQPKPVTLVYPFYCNPKFLRFQLEHWWKFPPRLRNFLCAIIVDDGSPNWQQAKPVLRMSRFPFPIWLYEIEVDVPWNWLAAKNIGMKYAATEWCMGTDMDHVLPQETAECLIYGLHDPKTIYRFQRKEIGGKKIHPHPNSWFMTRDMFWDKFGGYDEALSGHYGSDGDARRRWAAAAEVKTMIEHLERCEHHGDSSTTNYKRKQPSDLQAIHKIIAARGTRWKPKVLSFPYHQVQL